MSTSTTPHNAKTTGKTTESADETARFSAIADTWWDPEGKMKPLHKFNPVRLDYVRQQLAAHFGRLDQLNSQTPFTGLTLLDVGCGGGLIAEPMARMGFEVTAIDAAEKNIKVAALHAERSGLSINYRNMLPEELVAEGARFDVVLSLEVVEHVADVTLFLNSLGQLVKPGGGLVAATLNRTLKSLALAKIGAEYIVRWLPPGTHDWRKFVKPAELAEGLTNAGLNVTDIKGMSYNPLFDQWKATNDLDVNYMMTALKAA